MAGQGQARICVKRDATRFGIRNRSECAESTLVPHGRALANTEQAASRNSASRS